MVSIAKCFSNLGSTLRGFIVVASRADVYTTSASASNVSVYTNTICVAKCLLGNPQALELHPMDAGCTFLQNVLSVLRMKHGKRTH
jgi:hypothetical protein